MHFEKKTKNITLNVRAQGPFAQVMSLVTIDIVPGLLRLPGSSIICKKI
jgi:hypothetical protein